MKFHEVGGVGVRVGGGMALWVILVDVDRQSVMGAPAGAGAGREPGAEQALAHHEVGGVRSVMLSPRS